MFNITAIVHLPNVLTGGPTRFHSWTSVVFDSCHNICDVSKELEFILFADDTNVFFCHKNLNFLIKRMNFELIKLASRFHLGQKKISVCIRVSLFSVKSRQFKHNQLSYGFCFEKELRGFEFTPLTRFCFK